MKAEMGRVREGQRREETRREEKRRRNKSKKVRRKSGKDQKKVRRKQIQVANSRNVQLILGSGGWKSWFAKAAGAEPDGE